MSTRKHTVEQSGIVCKVAAAVIEKDGKILIAKRKKGHRFGGYWEFPGGKIKAGERPEDGLRRELREELGVEAKVGEFLCAFPFQTPEWSGELLAYKTRLLSGHLRCHDHEEILWAEPQDLENYHFTEPDRLVIGVVFPRRRTAAKTENEAT